MFLLQFAGVGFSLALPVALGLGNFLVIVVLAPLLEEIFFRFILLGFLQNNVKLKFLLANTIQASIFALFHIQAYGGLIEAKSALYVSALIFGFSMGVLGKVVNPNVKWYFNIIPLILAHALLNFLMTSSQFVLVGGL